MAQTTIVNLLTQQAHVPDNSIEESVYGEKQQAAAYILASRDLQTITWHFSGTFDGYVRIQSSLVLDPEETDWVTVYEPDTDNFKDGYYNLRGNYVWLRAVVTEWYEGEIQLVTASY